jgi:hypothetical protein
MRGGKRRAKGTRRGGEGRKRKGKGMGMGRGREKGRGGRTPKAGCMHGAPEGGNAALAVARTRCIAGADN